MDDSEPLEEKLKPLEALLQLVMKVTYEVYIELKTSGKPVKPHIGYSKRETIVKAD